jgi:parallel beta-helix repeat protein
MPDLSQSAAGMVTVSTSDGLIAALALVHSGETIQLAPGAYGSISLSGLHFDGAVTIQSADNSNPAVLSALSLNDASGFAFNHLDVSLTGDTTAVTVLNSSNVTFSNMSLHGVGVGEGLLVRDSSGVSIGGSDFRHIGSGIAHVNDDRVTFSNNTFYDLQTDGIFGGGSSHVIVEGNHFSDFHPQAGDHPDAIQFWSIGGTRGTDITIRGNVIIRGGGDVMQGIFIEDSDRVTIVGNAMSGTMYNGISLSATSNSLVDENFVQGLMEFV